tara:strand:+ start:979 stop:1233 length:255 start_codon:yes stop_codon:yes gene_type:complete
MDSKTNTGGFKEFKDSGGHAPMSKEAEKRKLATLKKGQDMPDVAKMPQREEQGKARDFAAKQFNVSARYIQDAKKVKSERPEQF